MRKLHGFASLLIPVRLHGIMWPQARPKHAQSPSPTLDAHLLSNLLNGRKCVDEDVVATAK